VKSVDEPDEPPDAMREPPEEPPAAPRLAKPAEPKSAAQIEREESEWRAAAEAWAEPNRAVLVFTDDPRFDVATTDAWAPPPEKALPSGVEATAKIGAEEIRITTTRPGHPLLVKVSYHPRWRAEGASGPYLVSPGLMMIVPSQAEVRLTYTARTWSHLGTVHTVLSYSTEAIEFFVAEGLEHVGIQLDDGEFLEIREMGVDEMLAALDRGEITDVKTVAALLLYARRAGAR
jgi:hypothetical protein